MAGSDLIPFLTTGRGGVEGDPSTPADSLGEDRASDRLDEIESTITSSQTVRTRSAFVDTARIGDGADVHALKWIAMQTGPSAPSAARVMSFDSSTGVFKLDRSLEGAGVAASGDFYRIFDVNNVWPDVTAAQAAAGESRYRALVLRNQHGSAVTNVRMYFRIIEAGGPDFARLHPSTSGGGLFLNRANGSDQVDILDQLGQRDLTAGGGSGADLFGGSSGWVVSTSYGNADGNVASMADSTDLPLWIRRLIPANVRFRRSVAVQLIVETDTTGSDPDPLSSSIVMPYNIDGGTITATLEPDRYLTRGGGTRINGTVSVDGLPLPSRPVLWEIEPGDLGSLFTDDTPIANYDTTDEDGKTAATLHAEDSDAEVGQTTHPRISVGDGGEVGDPS